MSAWKFFFIIIFFYEKGSENFWRSFFLIKWILFNFTKNLLEFIREILILKPDIAAMDDILKWVGKSGNLFLRIGYFSDRFHITSVLFKPAANAQFSKYVCERVISISQQNSKSSSAYFI